MDLRDFISQLKKYNELKRINGADWKLEIGTITELSDEKNGPALLFDNIKDYPSGYRVITNATSSTRRMALAFGLPADVSNIELVRQIKDELKNLNIIPPITVKSGPIFENIQQDHEVNLLQFPTPLWHEEDGGRYLGTGDMVITRDLSGKWINVGTYRVQLHDRDTLGLYISPGHHGRLMREGYWSQGKACPVAVVFGAHPLIWISSFMAFPWGAQEFDICGGLLKRPLDVIIGAYTGLPIPASSEIVIEGDCPPPDIESRSEGPFGEWSGYYASGARHEPVIKVKRITYRNDPIIYGAAPLKPPSSGTGSYIIRAANIWQEIDKLGVPGIKGVYFLRAGGSRLLCAIAIKQMYSGHTTQVGMAAMSGPEGACLGRYVIIVDEDIDPSDTEDVLWALTTRCDPATSMDIITGCWATPLDPTISSEKRSRGDITNTRVLMNACRPFHDFKDFPPVSRASNKLRATTFDKWKDVLQEN